MINYQVTIQDAKIRRALQFAPLKLTNDVRDIINKYVLKADAALKFKLQREPKTGRVYKRGRKRHKASAKGEAPATDSGRLVKSLQMQFANAGRLSGAVYSGLNYARELEEAKGRPYFSSVQSQIAPQFNSELGRAVGNSVRVF